MGQAGGVKQTHLRCAASEHGGKLLAKKMTLLTALLYQKARFRASFGLAHASLLSAKLGLAQAYNRM